MNKKQAILLLLLAVFLASCVPTIPQNPAVKNSGIRNPVSGPSPSQSSPKEPVTEVSITAKTGDTSKEDAAKRVPPIPPMIAEYQTGLLTPGPPEKAEKPSFAGKEKQKIVLNFEKADVGEVTNVVFQDYLKVNYVLDPALQGRISLYLEGEFTKEELFQLITKAYEANNLSVTPRKGIYYIQPIQRSSSGSLAIANTFILKDEQNGARPIIVMYRLRYMDVKQAINTIKFFLTPGRPITSDNMSNSIIFVEDADNARSIVDVLKALDINVLQEVSMEIVPLLAITPQDAAQAMEALISKLDVFKESSIKSNVAIIPLVNFGGVLVLAHNPEVMKTAKYWLTALDVQGKESGEQIYVYFVQNSLAKDVGDILNQVFGLSGRSSEKRPDQQIVSSTSGGGRSSFGSGKSGFGSSSSSTGSGFSSSSGKSAFGSSSSGMGSSSSGMGGTSSSGGSGSSQRGGKPSASSSRVGTGGAASTLPSLSGEVMIIPDEVNNAIVVRANALDYAKIKKTLEALDILPRTVLIEVLIAEITLDKTLSYGLEWYFKNIGVTIGGKSGKMAGAFGGKDLFPTTTDTTIAPTPTAAGSNTRKAFDIAKVASSGLSLFWGSTDTDIGALINLLAEKTHVNVLSTPTLLATDNKEASITVGGREPIPTGSVVGSDVTPSTALISSIQYEETGIILNVTPHINAGGLVRLEIEQTIRNVLDKPATIGANNTAPRFSERNVKTTLLAQNGSTVVIGGIIEQHEANGKTGIPFLQDVPILSPLFSTRSNKSSRTELIIAITPHVVDHRESQVTKEFLDKLRVLKGRIETKHKEF